jgi:NitT/TauT family transport system permease protein
MRKRDLVFTSLIVLLMWQIIALLVNRDILPTPLAVAQAFVANLGEIAKHFVASGFRVIVSILIAVALAVPAGLGMGQIPTLNRLFSPLVYLIYPIPKIVFFPIILLFLGPTEAAKILTIVLILFFQILVPVRDESLNLRPELLNSVKSLGAGRRALFRFVYLPSSWPIVLTTVRLSVGTAVAVLYFTEVTATYLGLGYYIFLTSGTLFDYAATYAGAIAMGLLGLVLYFFVDWLEKRLCPWKFAT